MSSTKPYTIQSGDTLWRIAKQHNTTVAELARINEIANPDKIRAGQVIKVPDTFEPAKETPLSTEAFLTNLAQGGYDYMKAQLEEKFEGFAIERDARQPFAWTLTPKAGGSSLTASLNGNTLTVMDKKGVGASVQVDNSKEPYFDMMYESLAEAVSTCKAKFDKAREAASFSAEFFLDNLSKGGQDFMKDQLEALYPDFTVERDPKQPYTWTLTAMAMGDATMTANLRGNQLTLVNDNSGYEASVEITPQEPYFDMMYEQLPEALQTCKANLDKKHEAASFSATFFLDNLAKGGWDFMKAQLEERFPDYVVTRDESQPYQWTLAAKAMGDATMTATIDGNTVTLTNDNKGDSASVEIVPQEPYFDMMYEQLADAVAECRHKLLAAA